MLWKESIFEFGNTSSNSHETCPMPLDSAPDLAFYCVADAAHFLGLVALVNSLRVKGHDEPVYVLDCGFESWQRDTLASDPGVVLVEADRSTSPKYMKVMLPLEHPASVMVVVDVDVIFTGRLDALVTEARSTGKPVLFPNDVSDRFKPGWERLGFGPPVPHTYVASGQIVLPAESGYGFLTAWAEGLRRVEADPALASPRVSPEDDPFFYRDMDTLNALIGTVIPLDSYALTEASDAAYWPFAGIRIIDQRALEVEASDGSHPVLLHHILDKPWNSFVAPNPYSRLMTRLLCGDDVPLQVPLGKLPQSLQFGVRGDVARVYVRFRAALNRRVRGRLGLRARLARRRFDLEESRQPRTEF